MTLIQAIKQISYCAQTTGGTAGRDQHLVNAIDDLDKVFAGFELPYKAAVAAYDEYELRKCRNETPERISYAYSEFQRQACFAIINTLPKP